MWNELESYKNHFLQLKLRMPAEQINTLTQNEFNRIQKTKRSCQFPTKVKCCHSTYFKDRPDYAYGWFALPKLMREMCSDHVDTQWRAINGISEFLLNPMHAQRAITEMEIVRKAHNAFSRFFMNYQFERYREIARLLHIFYLLSFYLNGADQIVRRVHLIEELYKIIINNDKNKEVVAKILRNLSEKPEVMLYMLDNTDGFRHLATIFCQDPCAPYHPIAMWMHLSHFLELSPEQGIERGFFELLHRRILGKVPLYHQLNMKCFALLLRCAEGQKRFDAIDGVLMMHHILNIENLNTYEFAVLTFLHGLQSKRALWRCREFTDLPDIMVRLAKVSSNPLTQLYCLQALRQLGEMPCIKRYIRHGCMTELNSFNCLNELNECTRDELIIWLNREVYDSSELY